MNRLLLVVLFFSFAFMSCSKLRDIFSKNANVSEQCTRLNTKIFEAMRDRLSGNESLVRGIDSSLGYIGISSKNVVLSMNWDIDTMDMTGDGVKEILLYIKPKDGSSGILVVYDAELRLKFKDSGVFSLEKMRPHYGKIGFVYYKKESKGKITHVILSSIYGKIIPAVNFVENNIHFPMGIVIYPYSDRLFKINFISRAGIFSEYVINLQGKLIPVTDNLHYILHSRKAYLQYYPSLKALDGPSYLGFPTDLIEISPDSTKLLYAKGDTLKLLYIDSFKKQILCIVKRPVSEILWRPNSQGFLIKYGRAQKTYRILFFHIIPEVILDMNTIFIQIGKYAGSIVYYNSHPEIDNWIKDIKWLNNNFLSITVLYYKGYPDRVISRDVYNVTIDALTGQVTDVKPVYQESAEVPRYRLTDVIWTDKSGSVINIKFNRDGTFFWRTPNSYEGGSGTFQLEGKRIVLHHKYSFVPSMASGDFVQVDTVNIARIEYYRMDFDPDGQMFLVTGDGIKLYGNEETQKKEVK